MSDELNFNAPTGSSMTQPARESEDASKRRAQILALLRGRLHYAILLALILGGGLGYLGYKAIVPLYTSTGSVVVNNESIIFEGVSDIGNRNNWTTFLRTQENLILSSQVAERALASDTWKDRGAGAQEYDTKAFSRAIEVTMDVRDTRNHVFDIAFHALDPVTAAAGNSAAIMAYQEEFGFQAATRYSSRIAQLQSQVQRAELAIKNQLALRRTIMTDAEFDQLEGQIAALQRQQFDLRFQLDEVRAQLDSRNPARDPGTSITQADLINVDPVLQDWQMQLEAVQDQITLEEARGRGPNHREVRLLSSQRDTINGKIKERMDQLMGSENAPMLNDPELDMLRRLEQQWHRQLNDVGTTLAMLGKKRMDVAAIVQEITSKQSLINQAREEMEKIRVEIDSVNGTVRPLAMGGLPTRPSNGGTAIQFAALGGLSGVMLGFGLVMLIGVMDRRLRHAGDAQMGMPTTRMLGILPTLPENFADPEQSEKAAHAVHHIRTLLQISNRGTARVFSVTSPAAGSGKSSLAVALGLSFAASESKTLVIDCDLVGAGLTRRVGAVVNRSVESILREDTVLTDYQIAEAVQTARAKGINIKDALVEMGMLTKKDLQRLNRRQADSALGVLDACQGRAFSECVAHTGIDNFYVLPIGAAKPQDAGLLSPKALRSLIGRAREEYDVVLIDTGPCLGSLEASMAAAESDATVLIVSRGDSKTMATRARDHLQSVGANVVGIVFNHALDTDMNHSSFASIVSQERRTDPAQSLLNADPAAAARFGPLGSAVAAFGTPSKSPNGKPRRAMTAATNGHGR